jgi:putative ABC transport system ATP-binding protein
MAEAAPIRVDAVSYGFGSGDLRRQVLFDVSVEIRAGEIVILTGPSGSGKTTLLTLVGALRSVQEGSLEVLGQQLNGASASALESVRRRIGYVFQAHNLLDALTASQNVQLALLLQPGLERQALRERAADTLRAVGLGERLDSHPSELSGGQRQRVAIARALAHHPRIILADEPTASLDRKTGRDVVELIQKLARRDGVTVLLVTHDNRILDIADRIVHLEDGHLYTFHEAVMANTQQMLRLLSESNRKGELRRRVEQLPPDRFTELLEQVTGESEEFLRVSALGHSEAFESMLAQALDAFTFKLSRVLDAERSSLFLVDRERDELWLLDAQEGGGKPLDIRMPLDAGIAGRVARTGRGERVDDAYAHPDFYSEVDRRTGFRTRSVLALPVIDHEGRVFAVAQLLNRCDGEPFDAEDEARFRKFIDSLGVILETWWTLAREQQTPGPR